MIQIRFLSLSHTHTSSSETYLPQMLIYSVIFLLFSNTFNLRSFLKIRGRVSRSYKVILKRITCILGAGLAEYSDQAMGWTTGVRFPAGTGYFSPSYRVQTGSGVDPAPYPMGTVGFPPRIRRPGREADHSPPSSADVEKSGAIPPLPRHVFRQWFVVKHKGQLYLLLHVYYVHLDFQCFGKSVWCDYSSYCHECKHSPSNLIVILGYFEKNQKCFLCVHNSGWIDVTFFVRTFRRGFFCCNKQRDLFTYF
jgi:hypothetical protein